MERSASRSTSKVYIGRYVATNSDSVIVDLDLVASDIDGNTRAAMSIRTTLPRSDAMRRKSPSSSR